MDIKREFRRWQLACNALSNNEYQQALGAFSACQQSAKLHFNMGMIHAILGQYRHALNKFAKAVELDPYFSIGYFQAGVCHFLMTNFVKARTCFDKAYNCLRGNKMINYGQLGLDFMLYACEVLYNRGVCHLYLRNEIGGMMDFFEAQQLKINRQHDLIDDVIHTRSKKMGIYSVPPGVIFQLTDCQRQIIDGSSDLTTTFYKMCYKAAQKVALATSAAKFRQPAVKVGQVSAFVRDKDQYSPMVTVPARSSSRDRVQNRQCQSQPIPKPADASRVDIAARSTSTHYGHLRPSKSMHDKKKQKRASRTSDTKSDSLKKPLPSSPTSATPSSLPLPASSTPSTSPQTPSTSPQTPSSTAQCTIRQLPRSRSVPSLRSHNLPPIVTTTPALHCPPLSFSHISSSSLSSMASSYNTQAPTTPDEHASPCDDHPLPHANTSSASLSLKIKVKLHYKDTRVIKLAPTTCYQDLVQKVHEKLDIAPNDASAASLALSYKNKQQSLIILVNPGPNWCIADLLEVSFQRNPLVVDKIELWCETHV